MIANGKFDAESKTTNQLLTISHSLIIVISLLGLLTQVTGQIDWQKLSLYRSIYFGGIMVIFSGTLLLALASLLSIKIKKYQSIQLRKLASTPRTSLTIAGLSLILASSLGAIAIFAYSPLAQVSLIAADAVRILSSWLAALLAAMSWLVFSVSLDSQSTEVELQNNVAYWLRAGFWACLPIVGTLILVSTFFAATPLVLRPSDGAPMFYWHQAKTFSQVGFSGGYYTYYELPAKALFTRFGPHGPIYPLIYGSLGAIFGWHAYSAILYNHVLLAAAFLAFVGITRLPQDKLWLGGMASGLFPPVLLFAGRISYESFNQALAILMAAILWTLLKQGTAVKMRMRLFVIGLGFFCAAARPTWAMMMVPLVFLILPEVSIGRRIVFAASVGSVMAFGAYRLWAYMTSPYGLDLPLSEMETLTEPAFNFIDKWLTIASENIQYIFSQPLFSINAMLPMAAFGLLLFSIFMLGQKILFLIQKKNSLVDEMPDLFGFAFHIFNILVISAFLLPFLSIIPLRGVRYLGVSLLVSIFFLLAQGRYKIVLVFIVLSVAGLPSLLASEYRNYDRGYKTYPDQSAFEELRTIAEEYILYQPSQNGWCNSLLLENLQQPFMVIPAGIGLASKFEDEHTSNYQLPLKSRYLILDKKPPGDNWTWLTDTPFGDLYLNTLTECPPLPYQ